MNRENYPAYVEGISLIQANDRRRFRKLLKGGELSQVERTLLKARGFFRLNRPDLALRILQACTPQSSFFAGERSVLLAHACFLNSDFEGAAIHNLVALECYTAASDRRGTFLSLYNLSVDYNRIGALKLSEHFLVRAEKCAQGPVEESCVHRAIACQLSMEKRYDEACEELAKAMRHRDHLKIDERAALHAVAADIYFRAGKNAECSECLMAISRETTHHTERARVEFELKVLAHIQRSSPLPARSGFVKRSEEYDLKWNILRALQAGEQDRLARLWRKLCGMFPLLYGENFSCVAESERNTIFYTYFLSLCRDQDQAALVEQVRGRIAKLHELLNESATPLRKEDLIERIWNVPYDPKLDARFYKLVERLKKVSKVPIITLNRTYAYSSTRKAS